MPEIPTNTRTPEPLKDGYIIGEKIGGRFEILKIFGGEKKSGMGIVYICYDHTWKRKFALKTFQAKFFGSQNIKNAFKREALTWINLGRHTNIVQAIYTEEMDGRLFLILEYVEPDDSTGWNTLAHYLINTLPLEQILDWAIQFCYGMEYAIDHGLVMHRDIKPDNIMITKEKTIKITDFGISQAYMPEDVRSAWSVSLQHRGPQLYESPEPKKDIRSDIYSFGVVLHQMATGGKIPYDAIYITGGDTADIPLDTDEDTPELSPIIRKCLEKRPEERYENFYDLRQVLEEKYREITGIEHSKPAPSQESNIEERDRKTWSDYQLERLLTALDKYEKLAVSLPNDAETITNLGMVHARLGHWDDAIRELTRAIHLNPRLAQAHNNLAIVYRTLGKYEQAIAEYEEAIRLEEAIQLEAALYHEEAFQLEEVIQSEWCIQIEDIFQFLEDHQDVIDIQGTIQAQLLAVLQFEEYEWVIQIVAALHDENVIRLIESILMNPVSADPTFPVPHRTLAGLHYNLGTLFHHLNKYDNAIEEYTKAMSLNPKYAKAFGNIGLAYYDKALHEKASFSDTLHFLNEAVRFLNKAVRLKPDYAEAYLVLGSVYGTLKDKENTIRAYENFISYASREDPDYDKVLSHLEKLYR